MSGLRAVLWLCAFGLGACAAVPSDPAAPGPARAAQASASLAGTRWVGDVEGDVDHRALPRLEFVSSGRVAGYTGCNMFSGVWRMEGDTVRLGALIATKRMCIGPGAEIEKRFLAALGEEGRGRREGDRLVFTAPGGERFEFAEAAAT